MDPTAALRRHFGYPSFRPGQEALVRAVLAGRDALGLLPTGAGKSVTYLLPALMGRRPVLVVSPLVSLMTDQEERARALGLRAAALHSGLPSRERARVTAAALAGEMDLLLVAPERLSTRAMTPLLRPGRIGLLAVDEAHCVVHWGYDFRPDYLALAGLGGRLRAPVLAVTATATPAVRRTLERVLALRDPERVATSFDRPNLYWHAVRVCGERHRWERLLRETRAPAEDGRPGPTLVYAPTRARVEALRHALARRGVAAEAYHAGLPPEERARVQHRFLAGGVRVVVATNAFGMGVDKADVRAVIHWSPPASPEAWYQEAGRAGRDGAPARCVLLWDRGDLEVHRRMQRRSRRGREERRAARQRLTAVRRILRRRSCLRGALLAYLGEPEPPRSCGRCSRCPPTGAAGYGAAGPRPGPAALPL
jgi:ATP-dependent DNA helicase RecQ